MSTTPAVPAAKPAAPAAPAMPSIADKIATTYNKAPELPGGKVAVPPTQTDPVKPVSGEPTKPEPKVEMAKPTPTLLPKKAAPVAPVMPPAGDDPDAKFTLPDNASDEQKSQWTQLKQTARERYNRIKELETKVNAPAVLTADQDRKLKEYQTMADRLAVIDLSSHPDFKRQYSEPKSKALAEVSEVLAYSGKEGVDLPGLLGKNRKDFSAAVTELTKDLSDMDKTTVQAGLREAYRVSLEEKGALAKADELQTQLRGQAEAQAKQAFEEVSSNLGQLGEFLVTLDVPDGATAEMKEEIATYNQEVSAIRQRAEQTVFGRPTEKTMAELGWKGATLDFLMKQGIPRMERTFSAIVAERDALAKELQGIKAAKGGGPIVGDPGKGGDAKKTTDQLVADVYGR